MELEILNNIDTPTMNRKSNKGIDKKFHSNPKVFSPCSVSLQRGKEESLN